MLNKVTQRKIVIQNDLYIVKEFNYIMFTYLGIFIEIELKWNRKMCKSVSVWSPLVLELRD